MKRSILALQVSITFLAVTSAHALTPTHIWSHAFGGTGSDLISSVALDASGNVFVTGSFSNTVDVGGGPLVSAGQADILIAKFSPTGTHLWSKRFGSTDYDSGVSIATDASGDVFVTGYFTGGVDFGSGGAFYGGYDGFILKLSSTGTYLWHRIFGWLSSDVGYGVATDASGNVLVAGYFETLVDMGGGFLTSAGGTDVVLAKYGPTGTPLWSKRFGSTGFDYGLSVARDGSGNALVTGSFEGTVDFGGGALVSAGNSDVFLAKYSPTGTHIWSERWGGIDVEFPYSVATDASGNVLATGFFAGTANFGGGALVSAGDWDIFVAKYSPTGAHVWSRRFGSTLTDNSFSVAADASGNVFATGYFQGSVDFGGGLLVSAGNSDAFLAEYSPTGTHLRSYRFGSTGYDNGHAVTTDATGFVFLAGGFQGTVDFGGGAMSSAGGTDMFMAKYLPGLAQPVITDVTDIGNDQGRQVLIKFARSGHDDPRSLSSIVRYEAYRRIDAPPASAAVQSNPAGLSPGELSAQGWTEVATVDAHGETAYSLVAPTIGDSTIAFGPYHSVFYVRASAASPYSFFDSPADSGYSLDNLAPGVPSTFAYAAGLLSWDESTAKDFDYFTVYGANVDAFSSATLVDYSVAPTMNVAGSPYVFYYVTATDFSGNEGNPAKVNTLSGAGGTPTSYVLSVSNFPNPFNPRTTVSYTVPSHGPVTIAIYGASGARVATLLNHEERDAGAYRVDWSGRTDTGTAVSSGVYFARIEHSGVTRTKKMVLLK